MKHILVAVAGSSPAIITETLWALKHVPEFRVTIDEVRILTTVQGAKAIREQLLEAGVWDACCQECGYDPLPLQIETLRDDNGAMEDIRTNNDNKFAADQIYHFIRSWTKESDEETTLHCSIAGGRKVMSAYLSNALMLCARPQDKAYHVLVRPEEFEQQGFYYPYAGVVTLVDGVRKQHRNAQDAQIELAEIYFVKLRELLSDSMLEGLTTYQEIVGRVQSYLRMLDGKATINVRRAELDQTGFYRVVVAIADCQFTLSPLEGVLYALLLLLKREHAEAIATRQREKEDDEVEVEMLPFINQAAIRRAYQSVTGIPYDSAQVIGGDFAELERWIELAEYENRVPLTEKLSPVRTRANLSLAWVPPPYKIGRRTYFIKVKSEQIHLPK